MLKSNKCKGCGLEANHDGFCDELQNPLDSVNTKSIPIDLIDIPDDVAFSLDALRITKVDVPLYLPDGTIGGKARVIEGDDEDAVLIEVESSNPLITELFKGEIIGVSLVHRPPNRTFIKDV